MTRNGYKTLDVEFEFIGDLGHLVDKDLLLPQSFMKREKLFHAHPG